MESLLIIMCSFCVGGSLGAWRNAPRDDTSPCNPIPVEVHRPLHYERVVTPPWYDAAQGSSTVTGGIFAGVQETIMSIVVVMVKDFPLSSKLASTKEYNP